MIWIATRLLSLYLLALPQSLDVHALIGLGNTAFTRAEYATAENYFRRALTQAEADKTSHPDIALAAADLAEVLTIYGRYGEAQGFFERAMSLVRQMPNPDPLFVSMFLNNYAALNRLLGRYDECESLLNEARSLLERTVGPRHDHMALILGSLGDVYAATNRVKMAESIMKKALELAQSSANQKNIVKVSLQLAAFYLRQNKPDSAISHYRRALDKARSAFGLGHPDAALAVYGLAMIDARQNKLREAEEEFRQARASWLMAFGPNHTAVAIASANLGATLAAEHKYNEAEAEYRAALDIYDEQKAARSPQLAATLEGYAMVLRMKSTQQANEMEQRAKSIRTELRSKVGVNALKNGTDGTGIGIPESVR